MSTNATLESMQLSAEGHVAQHQKVKTTPVQRGQTVEQQQKMFQQQFWW
jgi:hypothetical protein